MTERKTQVNKFEMPDHILKSAEMPLWTFLFELHNGRMFQGIFGKYTILFIPVTSLLFIMLVVTGIFDWFYKKKWN